MATPFDKTKGLTTNFELYELADALGIRITVVSKDQLKDLPSRPGNYIINLQDSDKGGGTHWVALKMFPGVAFYFDSFGMLPPIEVLYFVNPYGKKIRDLFINKKHIQNENGAYCGQYSLNFLQHMTKNRTPSLTKRFELFLKPWADRTL